MRRIKVILYSTSAVFFIIGLMCFISPAPIQTMMGLDDETIQIFGGVMLVVAALDVAIFPRILDKIKNK